MVVVAGSATKGNGPLRPVLELGPHLVTEPEQQPDHLGWKRRGEIGDDLGLAGRQHGVDQAGDHAAHVVLPAACRPRREPTGHQVAAGRVVGVVEPDDGPVGGDVGPVAAFGARGDEGGLVPLDGDDVVVARYPKQVVGGVVVDGIMLAEPDVGGVRVGDVEVAVQ